MVLEHTLERHVAGGKYCDIPLGIYMVKGDTVVLTAELVRKLTAPCPTSTTTIVSCRMKRKRARCRGLRATSRR